MPPENGDNCIPSKAVQKPAPAKMEEIGGLAANSVPLDMQQVVELAKKLQAQFNRV